MIIFFTNSLVTPKRNKSDKCQTYSSGFNKKARSQDIRCKFDGCELFEWVVVYAHSRNRICINGENHIFLECLEGTRGNIT